MAISTDRLGLDNLSTLTTSNYSTLSDTTSITQARSLSDTYSSSQLSALTPQIAVGNTNLSQIGIFGNNCNTALPASANNSRYTRSLNNNLGYGGNNSICSRNTNPLDAAFGNINNLNNFNNFRVKIPQVRESMLDSLITSEATSMFGSTLGSIIAIPLCLLSAIKNGILSAINKIGSTLANKLGLSNLFNLKLAQCLSKALSGTSGVNSTITQVTTGTMINNLSATDTATSSSMLSSMVASGATTNSNLISGFGYSLAQENDENVVNKLYLYNAVASTSSDEELLSTAYTKGNIDNVMTNLGNANVTTTTDPSDDYKDITKSLSYVDNSWNKDNDGNQNLYRTNGNAPLSILANANLTSNTTTNLSGTIPASSVSDAEAISIINANYTSAA